MSHFLPETRIRANKVRAVTLVAEDGERVYAGEERKQQRKSTDPD